jgi:serine/threonine protein kinase
MTVPGAAPPLEPLKGGPRQLGPFTLVAQIGAGRRTTAYLAHRGDPGEALVVRELNKGLDAEAFEAEVRGGRVFDPSLAIDVVRVAGGIVSASKAAIGESLETIIARALQRKQPVELDIALAIGMGVAAKLARPGEKRFHGDLVPRHVIVGFDGSIQVIDAACSAHRERSKALDRLTYRSPEHVRGDAVGPPSDVFSLGVLLFEMTTASRLFALPTPRESEVAILEGRLPRPRDIVGESYPIELQLVLRKLLRPSIAGRFPDGASARDALRLVAAARAEITSAEIGAWMRRELSEHQKAWQALVGDLAGPKEELTADPRERTIVDRSDTLRRVSIPADTTEPGSRRSQSKKSLAPEGPTQITHRVPARLSGPDDLLHRSDTLDEPNVAELARRIAAIAADKRLESDATPTPLTEIEPAPGPRRDADAPLWTKDPFDQPLGGETAFAPTPPPALDGSAPLPQLLEDFDSGMRTDESRRIADVGAKIPTGKSRKLRSQELDKRPSESGPKERPNVDVAADLLLPLPSRPPIRRDLTSDLVDAEQDLEAQAQQTVKAKSPIMEDPFGGEPDSDTNDTLDESSAFDVLPPGMVASVLKAAESMPEDDPRRSQGPWSSGAEGHPLRGGSDRTPPPPGVAKSGSARPAPSLAAAAQPAAVREKLAIPASDTMPAAAKPSLSLDEGSGKPAPGSAPQDAGAVPLWAAAQEMGGMASEANVPTQIVRERGIAAIPSDHTPILRRSIQDVGGGQSRVPTMIVRERAVPVDPAAVAHPRAGDSIISVEESSGSLVIPIPDDELDRAASRRRFLSGALILAAVVLVVVVGAYVLFVSVLKRELPFGLSEHDPRSETVIPGEQTGQRPVLQPVVTATVSAKPVDNGPHEGTATASAAPSAQRPGEGETIVHLKVRPSNARVLVDGRPIKGEAIEVRDKAVEVLITAPGFADEHRTLEPGTTAPLNILLRRSKAAHRNP